MRVKEWGVSGYKSILDEQLTASNLNILVGKNNSGKSNVLDSIVDYGRLLEDEFDRASWYEDHVLRKPNQNSITFDVSFWFSEEERASLIDELQEREAIGDTVSRELRESNSLSELHHEVTVGNRGKITNEVFKTNIQGDIVPLSKNGRRDREALVLEHLPSRTYKSVKYRLDRSFRNRVEKFFEEMQTIRSLRKPQGVVDLLRQKEIDEAGEDLVRVLGTLQMNDSDLLRDIVHDYESIMEGVSRVETQLIDDNEMTVEVYEEGYEDPFELDEISTGSKQILVLLTAIHLAKRDSDMLLVEEPEQNLHPGAEQLVYDLLRELSETGTQVFVTTHSEKFINETDIGDITTIYRNGANATEFRSVEGQDIEETLTLLGYDKSDAYHSNAVVFVEDQSDKVVLEQFAEKLGYPLEERGVRIVRVEGDNLYHDAEPMLKVIRQLRLPFKFVLDSDDQEPDEKANEVASKIGVNPENISILDRPMIESYLIEDPEPIRRAFNIDDPEDVEVYLEKAGKRNHSDVLNRISKDFIGQSMNKKSINGMVARHFREEEIPAELANLLDSINKMVEENQE